MLLNKAVNYLLIEHAGAERGRGGRGGENSKAPFETSNYAPDNRVTRDGGYLIALFFGGFVSIVFNYRRDV